jgi:hypothetical protein
VTEITASTALHASLIMVAIPRPKRQRGKEQTFRPAE